MVFWENTLTKSVQPLKLLKRRDRSMFPKILIYRPLKPNTNNKRKQGVKNPAKSKTALRILFTSALAPPRQTRIRSSPSGQDNRTSFPRSRAATSRLKYVNILTFRFRGFADATRDDRRRAASSDAEVQGKSRSAFRLGSCI